MIYNRKPIRNKRHTTQLASKNVFLYHSTTCRLDAVLSSFERHTPTDGSFQKLLRSVSKLSLDNPPPTCQMESPEDANRTKVLSFEFHEIRAHVTCPNRGMRKSPKWAIVGQNAILAEIGPRSRELASEDVIGLSVMGGMTSNPYRAV